MSARPLRVGVIGAGGIARHQHIPSYNRCDGIDIVAVCDTNEDALEAVRSELGIASTYTEYAGMLSAGALDLVSVCT